MLAKRENLLVIALFIAISIIFQLPLVFASCMCECSTSLLGGDCFVSAGIAVGSHINSVMINPDYRGVNAHNPVSSCSSGSKYCQNYAAPSTYNVQNGAPCELLLDCWDGSSCHCVGVGAGYNGVNSVWDASQTKCIACDSSKREATLCADSVGIYAAISSCSNHLGSCTGSGDYRFESACGADSACDEKSQGDSCTSSGQSGTCSSTGTCVVTPTTTTTTTSSTTTTTTTSTTTTTIVGSTTTTIVGSTTTTIVGSTTTTSLAGQFRVECGECFQSSECTCELKDNCNQGMWAAKNSEGTPLSGDILQELPPKTFNFTPSSTGSVEVKLVCYSPIKSNGELYINTTTLEVKKLFLDCPDECSIGEKCTCDVNGCRSGSFTAIQGDAVLTRRSITTESFEADFTPASTKVIDVDVSCEDPVKIDSTSITISGEPPPEEFFQGSNFVCQSTASGYKCTLDYTNDFHTQVVIVFTAAKPEVVATKEVTVSTGSGQASATFSCSSASGTIFISWKAYKVSDRRTAVGWSISTERQSVIC